LFKSTFFKIQQTYSSPRTTWYLFTVSICFIPGIGISADGAPNTPQILVLMSRVSAPGNVQASPPLAGGDPTASNDASAM
jgi:hypothetical protein